MAASLPYTRELSSSSFLSTCADEHAVCAAAYETQAREARGLATQLRLQALEYSRLSDPVMQREAALSTRAADDQDRLARSLATLAEAARMQADQDRSAALELEEASTVEIRSWNPARGHCPSVDARPAMRSRERSAWRRTAAVRPRKQREA